MARRIKLAAAVALVVVAFPAGRWMRHTRPWETPTERAHRLCSECGLTPAEIDRLIDPFSHPTLRRGQAIELFYATLDNDADSRLCRPCAEAILDAAGVAASRGEWCGKPGEHACRRPMPDTSFHIIVCKVSYAVGTANEA